MNDDDTTTEAADETVDNAEATATVSDTGSLLSAPASATTETTDAPTSGGTFDGSLPDNWFDRVDPELMKFAAGTGAADINGLLKIARDNQIAARAKTDGLVKLPTDDSTPEEVAAYRSSIGVPDTVEGYGEAPDGIDAESYTAFSEFALEKGLPKDAVDAAIEYDLQRATANDEAQAEWNKEQGESLRKEWGADFDSKRMDAIRAATTFGLDPEHPIFGDASMVKTFANIAAAISDDKLVSGASISNKLSPTSQADATYADMMEKGEGHPDYAGLEATWKEQMQSAYPDS